MLCTSRQVLRTACYDVCHKPELEKGRSTIVGDLEQAIVLEEVCNGVESHDFWPSLAN